ncbi:hypothetical protein PHLCEN_2v13533 [Hermanssonia centrifuga]|uniref:N-acetyltransferase domain-containing protein n=1 Tax=Hermanssonia centrifuga TaxID=98765 RepID=A0A2R6NE08_9APHY|nr:hypothetical protein PHLCEN_2v13533 [Hermanssonia centrifuga]
MDETEKLEDLFVKPETRGMGVGKAFFAELAKVAEEKADATHDQWNQPSIDFYEKSLGATAMSEWMGMRLTGDGIKNLEKFAFRQ